MRLFERRHKDFAGSWDDIKWSLHVADAAVDLRIPVEGSQGAPCGWLVLSYRESDPLVLLLSVCSLQGNAIIERTQLRSDVRQALAKAGCLPGLSIGPSTASGYTALVFQEGNVTLPVIVPSEPLHDFVRATQDIVSMTARAETEALSRAYHEAFSGRR
ncbi:MAG: hypothetical protein ABR548_14675 [Actinomycetota bacterium]|nr:hypothetical protein [Actinomycetota bacterium]